MGPVYARFSDHLPGATPIQPQKISPNSIVQTILPVTPTRSTDCAQNPANSMKTRNFVGGGRGCPQTKIFPISEIQILSSGAGAALQRLCAERLYSTAVSCNSSPLAKRAGLRAATLLTTSVFPWVMRSARILPVEGACITPCPLNPLAQKKPGTSSTGPRMQW